MNVFLLRQNRNRLDDVDYNIVSIFFYNPWINAAYFWLGAAFISNFTSIYSKNTNGNMKELIIWTADEDMKVEMIVLVVYSTARIINFPLSQQH